MLVTTKLDEGVCDFDTPSCDHAFPAAFEKLCILHQAWGRHLRDSILSE